jgi:hypothetical protein
MSLIQPYSCAPSVNSSVLSFSSSNCDFIITWKLLDNQDTQFTLTKLNIYQNQWISIGFSNNQSRNNADVVIGFVNQDNSSNVYRRFGIN